MSVLGLDSRYTVKYNSSPSGVPSGFALGNSFRQRGIFDRISLVSFLYGYSMEVLLFSKEVFLFSKEVFLFSKEVFLSSKEVFLLSKELSLFQ